LIPERDFGPVSSAYPGIQTNLIMVLHSSPCRPGLAQSLAAAAGAFSGPVFLAAPGQVLEFG
jgi:hypothetical protein